MTMTSQPLLWGLIQSLPRIYLPPPSPPPFTPVWELLIPSVSLSFAPLWFPSAKVQEVEGYTHGGRGVTFTFYSDLAVVWE